MVLEARRQRQLRDEVAFDWIVLRNRLSMLGSRNTRCVGQGLEGLSGQLNFRLVEGLAERVIFREFYARGLTALDTLDATTFGTRPTLSHLTARREIEALVTAMSLGCSPSGSEVLDRNAA
jgi:chromosome partitioning protein